MTIQAVIWDLDGTLLSTRRLYLEAYRRALAPYIGKVLTDDEILGFRSHSEIRFLKSQAPEQYDACMRDFQRYYADLHESHFEGVYPGVLETLAELRQRSVPMGIVTGKSRSSYEVSNATAKLGQFDVLVMDDDVTEPKPHPEGILAALQVLDVKPHNAVYVGDSLSDMEAAFAAGTMGAVALWSKAVSEQERFAERVRRAGEAVLLSRPYDLLGELMGEGNESTVR